MDLDEKTGCILGPGIYERVQFGVDKGDCWVLSTVYAQLNFIIIALDLT